MDFTRYFDDNKNFESEMFARDVTNFVTKNTNLVLVFFFLCFNIMMNMSNNATQSSKIMELSKQLNDVNEENQDLSTSNDDLNTSYEELQKENAALEEKVKTMNTELENLHVEFVNLNKTISMLQERNQVLCESLGDFLRYKRRKTDINFIEEPPIHPYNLRARKPVDYSGKDTKEEDETFDVLRDGK